MYGGRGMSLVWSCSQWKISGLNVPCSRLILASCSLFLAVFRLVFPVPGCFRTNVPCSRLFFSQCSLLPAVLDHVPCSRLFFIRCSLFPAVLGPMFPVPGNPFPSPIQCTLTAFTARRFNLIQFSF